jgi:DNA-binding XRE family transcriptional regulator
MSKEDPRVNRVQRFAKIWWSSRAEAGKSQEFMALGLGVSKKTIQNWEKGISSPDFFQGSEWFRLLNINPTKYYLAFLYPQSFGQLKPTDEDEKVEETLFQLIKHTTPMEKRELLFLMSGLHGSSWSSLLQMVTAHCHTSMKSRVPIARTILENYEMEAATIGLVCPDNIQPDLDILKYAIEQCKETVIHNGSGYTTANINDDTEKQSDTGEIDK